MRPKPVARVVELRGVEPAFPYYGEFVLLDDLPYTHGLLVGGGALVRPELLTQLDVAVGDEIIIGEGTFEIQGVILREPGGQLGAFSFGHGCWSTTTTWWRQGCWGSVAAPSGSCSSGCRRRASSHWSSGFGSRCATGSSGCGPTGGPKPGSREHAPGRELPESDRVRGGDPRGIGVWSVTRVFVQQRIRSVAILKCLGATSRQVLAIYVVQVVALGLCGSILGVVLAGGALAAIPASLADQAATATGLGDLAFGLTASAVAQGTGVGVVVSLLSHWARCSRCGPSSRSRCCAGVSSRHPCGTGSRSRPCRC